MCTTYTCNACGWRQVQHGKLMKSVRCTFCGEDIFASQRMAAVDKMLRKMGQDRRDQAFLEHYHE